jgi:acyl-coenzyme A thioesterase PaaI-like protein
MPAITEKPTQERLDRTQAGVHSACVVCGAANQLALHFAVEADGGVAGSATCHAGLQGYEGIVQGGVIAALLDSAMTNCLFARGIVAVTAEMTVRYSHPTTSGQTVRVRGWLARSEPPLYRVQAEVIQGGRVTARAKATFFARMD